jgi:glutamyl-tRNA synthetase
MEKVRVRFAPSPTGPLHIGGVRTALYNYLLARQTGGTMVLRIEDTDQNRLVAGAEKYILESLAWVGISIDEGPAQGGPYAPYRQSERKDIYRQYAEALVKSGHAYYAFDNEEELDAMREQLRKSGTDQLQYGSTTRLQMRNSLTLTAEETREWIRSREYVIRLKVEPGQTIALADLIRGRVEVDSGQIDDKVLMKSDGMPTYHLANVVDDYLMKVTHVIRGEEWLPSAPLHVLLYRYLGWEHVMPRFAHLPLLLKPDGNGKLSKRDADRMGFPIFPLNWTDPVSGEVSKGFLESGYLPEALINFLALLGWNPGTEQELFTVEELIRSFSLERIHKSGSKFDIHKAQWFNQQYLRKLTDGQLAEMLTSSLNQAGIPAPMEKVVAICRLLRERITFPGDLWKQGQVFFGAPETYDESTVSRKWNPEVRRTLAGLALTMQGRTALTSASAKATLEEVCRKEGVAPGKVLPMLRVALTGSSTGPDLMTTIEILGGPEVARRIEKMAGTLATAPP